MRILAGLGCLAMVPLVAWLGVVGVRHPEFRFWKHPILLGVFPRLRWGVAMATFAGIFAIVGVALLLD